MCSLPTSPFEAINSGTLRADRIIPAGPFTIRDLMNVLPMLSHLVVLQVNGEQLLVTLNNGVCQYPALEVSKCVVRPTRVDC